MAFIPLLTMSIVAEKEQRPFRANITMTRVGTKALVRRAELSGKCEVSHAFAAVNAGRASGIDVPAGIFVGANPSNTHFKLPTKRVCSNPASTASADPAIINPRFGRKCSLKNRDKVFMEWYGLRQRSTGDL